MAFCYKLFKIGVIILTLVQFGLGYVKVYQLFADIGSTSTDGGIGSVDSFSDLAWLPYLFIQIFTTVFILLQEYFLIRELCYDNFMYDHCFRCCFVQTALTFLLVIFPKTIINIVYHTADISIEEWWAQIVDTLDSLIANVSNLGFQIILYMRLLKKCLKFLRCCQQKVAPMMVKAADKTKKAVRNKEGSKGSVQNNQADLDLVPDNAGISTEEGLTENVNSNGTHLKHIQDSIGSSTNTYDGTVSPGCCLFVPMTRRQTSERSDDIANTQDSSNGTHHEKQITAKSVLAKKEAFEAKMDNIVASHATKVTGRLDKYSSRMKANMNKTIEQAKSKVANKLHIKVDAGGDVCKCDNPVISTSNVMPLMDVQTEGDSTANKRKVSTLMNENASCGKATPNVKVTFADEHVVNEATNVADNTTKNMRNDVATEQDNQKEHTHSNIDAQDISTCDDQRNKGRCETCGKPVRDPNKNQSRFSQCYNSKRMMTCRTLCGLLENRPLCMKITLTMSCVHFFVYIIELVFVFI